MQKAISHTKHQLRIYAHRGANLVFPENTIKAFSHAIQLGANALELDVHRTKDNKIVVFHDSDGLRVAHESAKIAESSYSDLKRWKLGGSDLAIPTLEEVIQQFPNINLNVDIKAHDKVTVMHVLDVINRLGVENQVLLTSESYKVTRFLRISAYTGPLGLSALEVATVFFLPKFLLKKCNWENRAMQIPLQFSKFSLATETFVEKCHDLGLRVDFWVINKDETAQTLWRLGADGIMTDDPSAVNFPST